VLCLLLVSRFCELYPAEDLFQALELPAGKKWLRQTKPLANHRWRRGPIYHRRRVRYFVDLLRAGTPLDPIEVGNEELYGVPMPILLDGHHRLVAHVLAGSLSANATYEGDPDLFAYLSGKTSKYRHDPR
jgi:hypothetical protein